MAIREFLERLRLQLGMMRGADPSSAKEEQQARSSRAAARARFWNAVHEGRSEAEAQCSKREP